MTRLAWAACPAPIRPRPSMAATTEVRSVLLWFIEISFIVGLHERGQRCLRSGSIGISLPGVLAVRSGFLIEAPSSGACAASPPCAPISGRRERYARGKVVGEHIAERSKRHGFPMDQLRAAPELPFVAKSPEVSRSGA